MAWDGSLELSFSNENVGAPGWIRTSGLWLRRPRKGDNRGQREAAAPDFIAVLSYPRPPEPTPSRYRLSVICQSTHGPSHWRSGASRASGLARLGSSSAAGRRLRDRTSQPHESLRQQKASDRNVFVDGLPMDPDAAADRFPVPSLLRSGS